MLCNPIAMFLVRLSASSGSTGPASKVVVLVRDGTAATWLTAVRSRTIIIVAEWAVVGLAAVRSSRTSRAVIVAERAIRDAAVWAVVAVVILVGWRPAAVLVRSAAFRVWV